MPGRLQTFALNSCSNVHGLPGPRGELRPVISSNCRNNCGSQGCSVCGQGLLLSLHPLHFFFIFLYYTDVGSTFFVLAAYLVSPGQYAPPNHIDHVWVGILTSTFFVLAACLVCPC